MKRRIAKAPDDLTQAAGIIPIASNTGRILLNRRGPNQDQAGTYSGWGGYCAMGETPVQNAIREFHEESSYVGPILLIPAYVQDYPNKQLKYETFVGIVPEEFEPIIDDESLGFAWKTMSEIYCQKGQKGPKYHPEFKIVIDDIKDMMSDLMLRLGVLNEESSKSLYNVFCCTVHVDENGVITQK